MSGPLETRPGEHTCPPRPSPPVSSEQASTLPARARGWGQPDLLGAMQGRPLVQLAVRARPDGGGERPDGALLSVLRVSVAEGEGEESQGPRSPPGLTALNAGPGTPATSTQSLPPSRDPAPAPTEAPQDKQGPYMSESSELDSSPWPSDFQRL